MQLKQISASVRPSEPQPGSASPDGSRADGPSDRRRASRSRLLPKALHNMKITLPQEAPGKLAQFFGGALKVEEKPRVPRRDSQDLDSIASCR